MRAQAMVWSVVLLGVALRIALACVNHPGNAYDDHIEAASHYASLLAEQPDPWLCWECYQPSLYYRLASSGARWFELLGVGQPWKAAQLLSASMSSLALIIGALTVVIVSEGSHHAALAGTTLLALLPRSLYSSACASNDAMLEAAVSVGILGTVWAFRGGRHRLWGLLLIGFSATWAGWTKQSGLLMMGPAGVALLWSLWKREYRWVPSLLGVAILLAGVEEAWRWGRTGVFLVSNQHYFDYASTQAPGDLSGVRFFDFRVWRLMQSPFMDPSTIDSWWTELFARLWFDYERRFLPVGHTSVVLGRALFGVGLLTTATTAVGMLLHRRPSTTAWRDACLLSIWTGFLAVPLLQTLRYPVFSSMKAAFILPAAPVMAVALSLAVTALSKRQHGLRWTQVLVWGLVLVGLVHFAALVCLNREAIAGGLSGPLWPIPPVPR